MLHNPDLSDEAIQRAWLALFKATEQNPRNPAGWVARIARNSALRVKREATKHASIESPIDDGAPNIGQGPHGDPDTWGLLFGDLDDEGSDAMWQVLLVRLDDDQRRFIELARAEMTMKQIAVAMRLSLSAAYRLRDRLKATLRTFVEGPDDDPPHNPSGPRGVRRDRAGTPVVTAPVIGAGGVRRRGTRAELRLEDIVALVLALPAFRQPDIGPSPNVNAIDDGLHFSELLNLPAFRTLERWTATSQPVGCTSPWQRRKLPPWIALSAPTCVGPLGAQHSLAYALRINLENSEIINHLNDVDVSRDIVGGTTEEHEVTAVTGRPPQRTFGRHQVEVKPWESLDGVLFRLFPALSMTSGEQLLGTSKTGQIWLIRLI